MSIVATFLSKVQAKYATGVSTEHSFRPALEELFDSVLTGVTALNEPKRVKCGAPDFIIQRGDIVVGHVEAKDLDLDLRSMKDANKNQQERYKKALPNLIYTNCLDFDFYREGELVASASIGDFLMGIQPKPDQFEKLENLLRNFMSQRPQSINSPKALAGIMAGKAALIKDVLANALKEDKDLRSELAGQYQAFKEHLIHDITPEDFSDIYAETIAYGMFAARLHDDTPKSFSRVEALELLPKSNPFLRSLFSYIAGPDLDDRIRWIIDDLADVFQATNMFEIMEGFGKLTGQDDPFLHFYETFLAAYNPAKRKARGVWYTPEPVVNFIVRAVDEVLQTEFGLADGLADTSKVTIDWDTGQSVGGKRQIIKKEVHRVQILDPATGTGTFLAEVIKQIAPKVKGVAEGMWSSYIERDLIPRLHGFELLMASYAMCHMKLDMILTELGYKPGPDAKRLSVYLTNSLEEGEPANQTLPFAQWLSNEVKEANSIKRDMPIMCVIGNPPYSVSSSNKGDWIKKLLVDYKRDLKERNIQPLSDDYIKFIRLGHHLIDKNGEGILAVITNNSYLDGIIHRQMRKNLLESFDTIYIADLHGSSKKKEAAPDGSKDVNVFDIMQGVSIAIMVRKRGIKAKGHQAKVLHRDIWGTRKSKYERLGKDAPLTAEYQPLAPTEPYYFFTTKDFTDQGAYDAGFKLDEFMPVNSSGLTTHRDHFVLDMDKAVLEQRIQRFFDQRISDAAIRSEMNLKDNRDWQLATARTSTNFNQSYVKICAYRPFDLRHIYYHASVIDFDRIAVMRHLDMGQNFALQVCRQYRQGQYAHALVHKHIAERCYVSLNSSELGYTFPLYLYSAENDLDQTRRVNFDPKIYAAICQAAGLAPDCHSREGGNPVLSSDASGETASLDSRLRGNDSIEDTSPELQVFDYIYGVLHCPDYRATYAEFLKIDFPRVPYPASPAEFEDIAAKGNALRRLHLMEPAAIGPALYPFKGDGNSVVEALRFENGRVFINKTQHFDSVPDLAWTFFIGGYQPAQKWLKDRKGRALSFEDVKHYQRIIKILCETDRIMKTISMTLEGG